jgi:hypothetical protein
MKKLILFVIMLLSIFGCVQRKEYKESSDSIQKRQQEALLREGTAQTGMPAINNFRERKILKEIIEMRDQSSLVTYTYLHSEQTNQLKLLCKSIGYPIPYATQYTNPQKIEERFQTGYAILPQADPNGLYSPSSAEGTWVLCSDPKDSKSVKPVYVEPRVITTQFPIQ